MTSWRSVDGESLRGVLTSLRAANWGWTPAEVTAFAKKMGWEIVDTIDDKGTFAVAPWCLGEDDIEFTFSHGRVNDIITPITDNVPAKDARGQAFLGDVLAEAAAVAEEVLGAPTQVRPGNRPQLRWRGSDATIILKHVGVAVELVWANNVFQDHWDQLRSYPE